MTSIKCQGFQIVQHNNVSIVLSNQIKEFTSLEKNNQSKGFIYFLDSPRSPVRVDDCTEHG